MARGHDAVVDELARPCRAEVAVKADRRANLRAFERRHAARHILRMARTDGGVRLQPVLRAAMAGFAADAVALLEARAAIGGVVDVAAEAHLRAARIADAEPRRDRLAACAGNQAQRAGMGTAGGRFFLPQLDFVLADDLAVAFLAAVAGGSGTGRDAKMLGRVTLGRLGGAGGCGKRDEDCGDRKADTKAKRQPGRETRTKARYYPFHARAAP